MAEAGRVARRPSCPLSATMMLIRVRRPSPASAALPLPLPGTPPFLMAAPARLMKSVARAPLCTAAGGVAGLVAARGALSRRRAAPSHISSRVAEPVGEPSGLCNRSGWRSSRPPAARPSRRDFHIMIFGGGGRGAVSIGYRMTELRSSLFAPLGLRHSRARVLRPGSPSRRRLGLRVLCRRRKMESWPPLFGERAAGRVSGDWLLEASHGRFGRK